jgi:hypothetical protein
MESPPEKEFPLVKLEKYGDVYKLVDGKYKSTTAYLLTSQESESSSIVFTAMIYDYALAKKLEKFLKKESP